MKIMLNKTFNALMETLTRQSKLIMKQQKIINQLNNEIQTLKEDNSQSDIIFPNTDERGLGDPDTPTYISDILSL